MTQPSPIPGPRRWYSRLPRALSYCLRVPLGLFILWQIVFLFGYNFLDWTVEFRDWLKDQRKELEEAREENEPDPPGSAPYQRLIATKWIGEEIEEWVRLGDTSALAKSLVRPKDVVEWWARRSGQEQGWSLFAPYTVDWTCFVYVELRWDDDLEPLRTSQPGLAAVALTGTAALRIRDGLKDLAPPETVPSPNQPHDINRFLRFGEFRTRRIETYLETPFRRYDKSREENLESWAKKAREKVDGQWRYLPGFLAWKLRRFQATHSDWPDPRQVVLRSRTWTIPPPGVKPWTWVPQSDEPVVRWRPWQFPQPDYDALEVYLHTEGRFENKKPS